MNWRAHGFTQRKPRVAGVYFVAIRHRLGDTNPPNVDQGWDVAQVFYFAGDYSNAYRNQESAAHWRIGLLSGPSYAWAPGTWLKGPISPMVDE